MPVGQNPVKADPVVTCYFEADFGDHLKNTRFTEISGISAEVAIAEHKILAKNGQEIVRKLPGRGKWGDLTLKRGLTAEFDVYDWRQQVVEGKVDQARTNGTIKMMEMGTNKVVAKWEVTAAWPSKISGPSFKSDDDNIVTEEITVVFENITRTL